MQPNAGEALLVLIYNYTLVRSAARRGKEFGTHVAPFPFLSVPNHLSWPICQCILCFSAPSPKRCLPVELQLSVSRSTSYLILHANSHTD